MIWISNNEPSDLRWAKDGSLERQSQRYLDLYGAGRSNEFKRRVVGDGWIERYKVMFAAMRDALVEPGWKEHVRFVGYNAFGAWLGWVRRIRRRNQAGDRIIRFLIKNAA